MKKKKTHRKFFYSDSIKETTKMINTLIKRIKTPLQEMEPQIAHPEAYNKLYYIDKLKEMEDAANDLTERIKNAKKYLKSMPAEKLNINKVLQLLTYNKL